MGLQFETSETDARPRLASTTAPVRPMGDRRVGRARGAIGRAALCLVVLVQACGATKSNGLARDDVAEKLKAFPQFAETLSVYIPTYVWRSCAAVRAGGRPYAVTKQYPLPPGPQWVAYEGSGLIALRDTVMSESNNAPSCVAHLTPKRIEASRGWKQEDIETRVGVHHSRRGSPRTRTAS